MRTWLILVVGLGIGAIAVLLLRDGPPHHEVLEVPPWSRAPLPKTPANPWAKVRLEKQRVRRDARVNFRVVDKAGRPIPTAEVLAQDADWAWDPAMNSWHDANAAGKLSDHVNREQAPRYLIRAPGYATRLTEALPRGDIEMQPAAVIRGRVIAEDHIEGSVRAVLQTTPLRDENMLVQLASVADDAVEEGVAIQPDGTYRFDQLPAGIYSLVVRTEQGHEQVFENVRPGDGPERNLILSTKQGVQVDRPWLGGPSGGTAAPQRRHEHPVIVRAPGAALLTDVELRVRYAPFSHRPPILSPVHPIVAVPAPQIERTLRWDGEVGRRFAIHATGFNADGVVGHGRAEITGQRTIIIDLDPPQRVSGRVVEHESNERIPYARVTAAAFELRVGQWMGWWCGDEAVGHFPIERRRVIANARGEFSFKDLDTTLRWRIAAATHTHTLVGHSREASKRMWLPLHRGDAIAGRIDFKGTTECPANLVMAWPADGTRGNPARPRQGRVYADGYFRIEGLYPGRYHVALHKTRLRTDRFGEQPVWLQTPDYASGTLDIRASLEPGRVVKCTVLDSDGKPRPHVRVVVNRRFLDKHVLTGADGTVEIGGLPKDRVGLTVYTEHGPEPTQYAAADVDEITLTLRGPR